LNQSQESNRYESHAQQAIFSQQNLSNTVASISQTSVRTMPMNATGGNFSNFSVNLSSTNGPQRNSIVGGRHIPIAKFARDNARGRAAAGSDKRVTSINFYSNANGTKLKQALDMSNMYDSASGTVLNSSGVLNDSMQSVQRGKTSHTSSIIANKAAYNSQPSPSVVNSNVYEGVYNQHFVLSGPGRMQN